MSTLPIPVTVWQANLQMYTFHILAASSDRDNLSKTKEVPTMKKH